MPETNETYHPMTFDAIKIGLASPEKIRSWTHRTPEPADKPSKQWREWWEQGAMRNRMPEPSGAPSREWREWWEHGVVKKPETINYRTLKPEKDVCSARGFLVQARTGSATAASTKRSAIRA